MNFIKFHKLYTNIGGEVKRVNYKKFLCQQTGADNRQTANKILLLLSTRKHVVNLIISKQPCHTARSTHRWQGINLLTNNIQNTTTGDTDTSRGTRLSDCYDLSHYEFLDYKASQTSCLLTKRDSSEFQLSRLQIFRFIKRRQGIKVGDMSGP